MGISLALGSLLVGAAGTVATMVQARKASKARREANAISSASDNVKEKLARRKSAREERLRRARMLHQSEVSGGAGSSGEIGAASSLGASFGAAQGASRGQALANQGITAASQRAADADSMGAMFGSLTDFAQGSLSIWDDYKNG